MNDTQIHQLITQEPLPILENFLGPVALRRDDDILGRGAITQNGLKSEIPRARAIDLARALDID